MIRIDISNQHQVDDAGILSLGIVVDQIGPLQIAQAGDDAVDDLVDAEHLGYHRFEFGKKGMIRIGPVVNPSALFFGLEQVRAGQLVELLADGVGGDAELLGQLAQVGAGVRVEKKPHQELDPGLGCDNAGKKIVQMMLHL